MKRRSWVKKVLHLLESYNNFSEDEKKRFFRELHSVITLKFSEEEIEKARHSETPKERIISHSEKLEKKKSYPIRAFFQPVSTVKGLGKKRIERLKKLGIETVIDAIYYLPYRYEDRTTITPMAFLRPDHQTLVKGKVVNISLIQTAKKKKTILKVVLYDRTGTVTLVFLQERVFGYYRTLFVKAKELNREVLAYGTVRRETGGYSMIHPEVEILDPHKKKLERLGTILPVYHSSEGVGQATVRKDIQAVVKKTVPYIREYLPKELLKRHNFPEVPEAFWKVHFPHDEDAEELLSFRTPAQKRVIFDELFLFQLALALHRQRI
jgi:ATP-dependent DNA helicase RecG